MILSNQFTSPEVRFCFPGPNPIEHHESVATAYLPEAISIPGEDHHVITRDPDGTEQAAELHFNTYNIEAGSTIVSIAGHHIPRGGQFFNRGIIEAGEFDRFDASCSYMPGEPARNQVIVQFNADHLSRTPSREFGKKGIAIMPMDAPLPEFPAETRDSIVRYRLLGIINNHDKLVTWKGPTTGTARLIDQCVINGLVQNRIELGLLFDDLPQGAHMLGLLATHDTARTYLKYFDRKRLTSFLPADDPRDVEPPRFPAMTRSAYERYRGLSDIAHYYWNHPRSATPPSPQA